jgi:hypothetical protein
VVPKSEVEPEMETILGAWQEPHALADLPLRFPMEMRQPGWGRTFVWERVTPNPFLEDDGFEVPAAR